MRMNFSFIVWKQLHWMKLQSYVHANHNHKFIRIIGSYWNAVIKRNPILHKS